MKYRNLRIAWSVAWGVLCLLLLALWARSFWRIDALTRAVNYGPTTTVFLDNGRILTLRDLNLPIGQNPESMAHGWRYSQMPASDGLDTTRWLGPGMSLNVRPLWPSVLLAAILAVIPLLHLPRRFSLRTLLIAATLVAVSLGLVVLMLRQG